MALESAFEAVLTLLIQFKQSIVYIVYQSYATLAKHTACPPDRQPTCPCLSHYLILFYACCNNTAASPPLVDSLQSGPIHLRTHNALERVFAILCTLPATSLRSTRRMHYIHSTPAFIIGSCGMPQTAAGEGVVASATTCLQLASLTSACS